jgi:hypothetical protein
MLSPKSVARGRRSGPVRELHDASIIGNGVCLCPAKGEDRDATKGIAGAASRQEDIALAPRATARPLKRTHEWIEQVLTEG